MFDQLSERLQGVLGEIRSRGKLSEDDLKKALREVRLALLEADVNFKLVKDFTESLRERLAGEDIDDALNPGQHVVKAVNDELTALMGGAGRDLAFAPSGTTVILMAGLQGSGKTTATAKLGRLLAQQGKDVALAACDLQRPAAVEQLRKMGAQAGVHVYSKDETTDAVEVAGWARDEAAREHRDVLIVDTAGRLHVDEDLMDELARIRKRVKPHDVLLVLDAMTGQDAVNVAESFADVAEFDGVVITKLDGDARGGAALSVRAVTGKPIIYASTGERIEQLERFHPDRMASRILGMGDVMSLIEKTQDEFSADQAADLEQKIRKQQFTLEDFLSQMQQVRKMGPLGNLLGMLPGGGNAMKQMGNVDERELDRIEAIILSMTPHERAHPEEINGSRRKRIAVGSGTTVQAVNKLTKQFGQMRKLMKQMVEGKMPDPQQLMKGMK
ncbi:MAG: signal recognition particle protein [Solirubrobacterales bacterium]|nr:signal recognition particle protein [Solirubrobacterales bacterium]